MKCDKNAMRLYAVTDRSWVGKETLMEQVEDALKGGVTCIQLREKELGQEDFLEEAREMAALCRRYQVPFIINDNVEVALASGADGVHIGQSDGDPAEIRARLGADRLLGVSARTLEEAKAAEAAGADYLGVGAVFSTTTKLDAHEVSRETLQTICATVKIPVVAIGGIKKDNIRQLAGSGVDGVALVSAIFGAEDIEKECRELRRQSDEMVNA